MKLTAAEVKRIIKPGKHPIGGSLYLQVSQDGARSWLFRYQLNNRRRWMGLGGCSDVSLSGARDDIKHYKRDFIKLGIDPLAEKAKSKDKATEDRRELANRQMTFSLCAEQYIESKAPGWKNPKHRLLWQNTLTTYAYPVIGNLPIAHIENSHILEILTPIWLTKTETANRVRGRIELVIDYATAMRYRQGDNPAVWRGNLNAILAKPSDVTAVKHHPALPYTEINGFMIELSQTKGSGAQALILTILCATRTSETLKAMWSEFDLEKKMWVIPKERMKAEVEHRVPLSTAALSLLTERHKAKKSEFLFPGGKNNPHLSNMSMTTVLRRMDRGEITVHGFRSTFRDWVAEKTNYAQRVAETALAHQLSDGTEAAYQRGDLLEKRRALMQDWADYCFRNKSTKVVDIRSA
jgi:integrase